MITHACQNGRFLLYFQRTGPQLKISQQVTTNSNNINRYSRLNQSLHTKLNHCINKGYLLQAGAHPSFCRMMWLGIFLLPVGWDAGPLQGYPQHKVCPYSLIHLGGERHFKFLSQEQSSQGSRLGLESEPLHPEMSALIMWPLNLPIKHIQDIKGWQ